MLAPVGAAAAETVLGATSVFADAEELGLKRSDELADEDRLEILLEEVVVMLELKVGDKGVLEVKNVVD